jgi:hypothetical protein
LPFPSFDHLAVSALDLGDRDAHSFAKGTAMEDLPRLLARTPRISVHLVVTVGAVGAVNAQILGALVKIRSLPDPPPSN